MLPVHLKEYVQEHVLPRPDVHPVELVRVQLVQPLVRPMEYRERLYPSKGDKLPRRLDRLVQILLLQPRWLFLVAQQSSPS